MPKSKRVLLAAGLALAGVAYVLTHPGPGQGGAAPATVPAERAAALPDPLAAAARIAAPAPASASVDAPAVSPVAAFPRIAGVSVSPQRWRQQVQALKASTNYRSFIHQALVDPTPEGVALAMRAWWRCVAMESLWRPEAEAQARQIPELDASLARLRAGCAPGTRDMGTALAAAAKRVGIPPGLGDSWVVAKRPDMAGLRGVIALGDGDLWWEVAAVAPLQQPAAELMEALGLAGAQSPAHLAVMQVALAVEGCGRFGCDPGHRRLMVCMQVGACVGASLDEQLLNFVEAQGLSREAWLALRSDARAVLASLAGR